MNDTNKITVLIVDDDPSMSSFLEGLLQENGFTPIAITGGDQLDQTLKAHQIHLVLMDLRLKNESGLTLAQQIQHSWKIPVIILTGVADEIEQIVGLEVAADDYIMKPFNPRELIARMRAVLRRTHGTQFQDIAPVRTAPEDLRQFGDRVIDFKNRRLLDLNDKEVTLTNAEFRLLEVLFTNPNTIFDRQQLLDKLGADDSNYIDRSIDVLILRLRRKIESAPSKPVFLQTRRGKGYIFVLE